MKIEFLMCGNHTDAFLSQAAIYRLMLNSLGGDYARARLVLCIGGVERLPLPLRWQRWFEQIEVLWVEAGDYREQGDLAQSELIYRVMDPSAAISIICDADTLLLRPLPNDFLVKMRTEPAISGCIAHYAPPLQDFRSSTTVPPASVSQMWERLAMRTLGRNIDLPFSYSLRPDHVPCPFYVNFGFVAATPELFRSFYSEFRSIVPIVRDVLDNDFCEQIALTFAVERAGLPYRALPIRFNFPNDPIADELYPDDAKNIVNLHYLRTTAFDRHRIFADRSEFDRLMSMHLTGSNATFCEAIRNLTGGMYPFVNV
jgi:hypothetical protein